MSTYNKKKITYNYLKDPHLYYHLESAPKITELLKSGLYELSGLSIVSK